MAEPREDREQKTISTSDTGKQNRQPAKNTRPATETALSRRNDYPLFRSPFEMFRNMSQEMDRIFGAGLLPSWGLSTGFDRPEVLWNPQVDMFERNGKLVVRADLPGLKKDDVKVELRDDILILEGERHEEHQEKDEHFFRSERSYGSFYRAVPLPEGASGEHCNATFNNGVLEITMDAPKQKDRAGRRIEISDRPTA